MNPPASPIGRSTTASPAVDASGYLLLTIQHALVKQVYDGQSMTLARGEMRLECVSLPIPSGSGKQTANPFSSSPSDPAIPTHDFWLVLRVGPTFELPIIPGQMLQPSSAKNEGIAYIMPSPESSHASLRIILPTPGTDADMEDLDSLEVFLRQYKSLGAEDTALASVVLPAAGMRSPPPMDEEMRGKLVLLNEETGEVVGELDQEIDVEEGKRLASDPKNRPVMLDFGGVVEGYSPKVSVQRVPEDEMDDWMLKGAHNISKGILSFGSWSSRMMSSGADMYIRNSTPRAEPVKMSKGTKSNIRRAHNASVKTVNVTKTTVGMINNAISKVVETTYEKGVHPAIDTYNDFRRSSVGGTSPPPVPSRKGQAAPAVNSSRPTSSPLRNGPPALPARTPSPLGKQTITNTGEKSSRPTERDALLARQPPAYTDKMTSEPASLSKGKRPLLNRVFLAGEVVLSSLESTAHEMINSGTVAASSAAGHKYGEEVGHATALLGGSVRNVAVVYIDARGVGRRALLKSTAKGFVKARLKNGEVVQLQGDSDVAIDAGQVERGEGGEVVVGMPETGRSDIKGPQAVQKR